MKRIIFNVFCSATYQSYLDVNDDFCHNDKTLDDLDINDVLYYIKEHLHEAPINNLEWLDDIDVEGDDVIDIISI